MEKYRFRGWDKKTKNYYHITNFICNDGVIDGVSLIGEQFQSLDEVELFLGSGLKDIRGQEIFEGDILVTELGKGLQIANVKFENGEFAAGGIPLKEIHDKSRIVGNIKEITNKGEFKWHTP